MRNFGIIAVSLALSGLAACEETTGAGKVTIPPPPEYMSCDQIPKELAIADRNAEKMGVYNSHGAYWAKRAERLSGRAYECKKSQRR